MSSVVGAEDLPTRRAPPWEGRAGHGMAASTRPTATPFQFLLLEMRRGQEEETWLTFSYLPFSISAGRVPTGGSTGQAESHSQLLNGQRFTRQQRPRCKQLAISPLAVISLYFGAWSRRWRKQAWTMCPEVLLVSKRAKLFINEVLGSRVNDWSNHLCVFKMITATFIKHFLHAKHSAVFNMLQLTSPWQ